MLKFLNIFSEIFSKRLSPEEINQEKENIKVKLEKKRLDDIKKYKDKIIDAVNYSYWYYSRQRCPNRERIFSRHQVKLGLKFAPNPRYRDYITEIDINCDFCGHCKYKNGVTSSFYDRYDSPYRLGELHITKEDLSIVNRNSYESWL